MFTFLCPAAERIWGVRPLAAVAAIAVVLEINFRRDREKFDMSSSINLFFELVINQYLQRQSHIYHG